MRSENSKASVGFIFITILIDAIGIGLIIPSLPDVMRRFNASPDFVNQTFGYFISVYALMQFIASPVLGALSDQYGRRPILLLSLLGCGLDYLLMAFAPSLWILFSGRILSGITGANHTVASSYMADISTDENRSSNFGMIGAAWGLGFITGPVIGGLLSNVNPSAPFLAAALFSLLNFIFGFFILPESLKPENRRIVSLTKINPFSSLFKILSPSPILLLVCIYTLINLAGQVHPSLWTLYTQNKFNWTSKEVGFSLAFAGVTIALSQGWLTRVLIPKLGENKSLYIGMICFILEFTAIAFATKGWMLYLILAVFSLSGIAMPALQSLLTKNTPADQQGELQGSLMSLMSFSSIIGPLLYTQLYALFMKDFSGISYFLAGIFSLVSLILFEIFLKKDLLKTQILK